MRWKRSLLSGIGSAFAFAALLGGVDGAFAAPVAPSSTLDASSLEPSLEIYKPREFAQMDFDAPDSRWSFARSRQSDHFIVFWEPGFGDDPNASTVPDELRVDVDDLLAKAEGFYQTNVEKLGFRSDEASYLDRYKLEIYLLYQKEWLATGSGYDDVIGALWVNPSTCKPVGATIAHEIAHSFQYQVYCDRLLRGNAPHPFGGFRYEHHSSALFDAPDASSKASRDGKGNALWEQCAQWQAIQDYPDEAFQWFHRETWSKNCHRALENEWFRYQSYWFFCNVKELHGAAAVGKVWNNAVQPDDFIDCYIRLFHDGDASRFNDELYRYASHAVTFDFDVLRDRIPDDWRDCYRPVLYPLPERPDAFQISYESCPDTSGFNAIPIPPERYEDGKISIRFKALAVGSTLAPDDPGESRSGPNPDHVDFRTQSYNSTDPSVIPDHRYGFVALLDDGSRVYSPMEKGSERVVEFQVPPTTQRLWFVVVGATTKHFRHVWNERESDDIQLPYQIEFLRD